VSEDFQKLKKELDSWRPFIYSLREPDREAYRRMISKIMRHAEAIEKSGRGYTAESLLMAVILSNQKTINYLEHVIERWKK